MSFRRDACVAASACLVTLGVVAYAQPTAEIMGSTAVEWSSLTARKTKVGEVRQVFQAPTATLDELEMHITTLMPGATPHEPHQHPDEELIVIKEGTVETLLGDRTQRVGPGSVIFQAANKLHAIRNVGDTPATYHVIKWNSPGMLKKRSEQ